MAVQQKWFYDRIATPGEAEGRACIFCGRTIANESQPAHWVLKAVEDNPDADFPIQDGYAHQACTTEKQAQERRGRFALPDVPDVPRR